MSGNQSLAGLNAILCLIAVASLPANISEAKYSGGTGDPNDPYQIATAEDLNDIGNHREDLCKHFVLVNDINLAAYTQTPFNMIRRFRGVFDGRGYRVRNFTYHTATHADHIGLFRTIHRRGVVKRLLLDNVYIEARSGRWVGALAGLNYGTILDCHSSGSVSGRQEVGGLVGTNVMGAIDQCSSKAHVSAAIVLGGLVGENTAGIRSCCATGQVTGLSGNANAGGLVGRNNGRVSNCWATTAVLARNYSGGLIGYNLRFVEHCYAAGPVIRDSDNGALIGFNNNGIYLKCFWDATVAPALRGIGGYRKKPNVIRKTTPEMRTLTTFTNAGWDFVGETVNGTEDTWVMCPDRVGYPLLAWQVDSDGSICLRMFCQRWLEESTGP